MLGALEWLVLAVIALALAWRFRPRHRSTALRRRYSVRWLMGAVLIAGLVCGVLARWYAASSRRLAVVAELRAQRQVTDQVITEARAELESAGVHVIGFRSANSAGSDHWNEQFETTAVASDPKIGAPVPPGAGRLDASGAPASGPWRILFVEARGGSRDGVLQPIIVRASAATLRGKPLLDRLTRAYRARNWRYKVVSEEDGTACPDYR